MKKLLLLLSICFLTVNSFAETNKFPQSGTIPFLGEDSTSDPIQVKDGRASDIQNVTLNLDGTADKRYGYSLKNGTLDTNAVTDSFEPVTGLYELRLSNGTNNIIAVCANKLFYDNSGTWTNITDGVTITEGQDYQWSWITALDYAIGTNGLDPPIQWNGTGNASAVGFTGLSSSITKAKCSVWWKNYLIFGNTTEGGTTRTTRIRWSNVGTINTWSDDDYLDIATQGGQQIEGFGILYDNLIIFLTNSIYKVSLVGGDELILVTKVSEGIGCIAKNSIQNILIDNTESLIFLSKDGTINKFNGTSIEEVSLLIEGTLENVKTSRLPYAVSAVNQTTQHYFLCVTNTSAATTNNLLLDYFYGTGEWSKHTGIEANAMSVGDDSSSLPQVYFGNYKSFVYQLDNENKLDDVFGYKGVFESSDVRDSATASGLTIIYDTDFIFYDVLLLHFNGTDGSLTFTDEAEHTFTANGDAQIDTAQKKFGSGSGIFDGAGDYINTPDGSFDHLGSGNFTFDFWIFRNSAGIEHRICSNYAASGLNSSAGFAIEFTPANKLSFSIFSGVTQYEALSTGTITADGIWHHIACVRDTNTLRIFIDGVADGTKDVTGITANDGTGSFAIGRWGDIGSGYFDGQIDEFRESKGLARWTADFTPSTSAYDNSGLSSGIVGTTLRIISGTGRDDERVVAAATTSGIMVTNSTTATLGSEYVMGQIKSFYTTKWYPCDTLERKNFENLYLWTTKDTNDTMKVYFAGDENSSINEIYLSDYAVDSLWGSKIVSGINVVWSGEELSFSNIPLNISGRFIKTKFEEDGIGESMNLHSYVYLYEALDLR